ncbi:MAG: hypothetical protein JXB45_08940 [Candidatus Krumholzibacteriota bacterium]|nr:hypothetical protein [Candidatus Krumholzibacteriota bacterium]
MLSRTIYNFLLPAGWLVARLASFRNEKIKKSFTARKGWRDRWKVKSKKLDPHSPLIWFHVSSVGEFLQAKPVIDLLTDKFGSSLQIALTFYSSSGMEYYEKFDHSRPNPAVRFVEYLPFDTPANARFCLRTIRPSLIVYVKFDLWPNLILEAAKSNHPQILVSGTLSPGSRRLGGGARKFYGQLYSKLSAIAAISEEDAGRFSKHLGDDSRIFVTGDTRFDQVCERIDRSTVKLPESLSADSRLFIIAGSSWPKDEAIVIPGFSLLTGRHPHLGLIVVPHEPTPPRLREIERSLVRENLEFALLSRMDGGEPTPAPVIVADGIGYLAELYRKGYLAYVGGSWTTGVHNVMEPAVLSLPVLFGPRISNSWEAGKLVELGVGRIVESPEEFARAAERFIGDRSWHDKLGKMGCDFIRNHCGAAVHCVNLIERYLEKGSP